ncbi:hypothetical protein ACWD62_18140 [Streptomyces sp. NPDC005146]
MSRSPDDLVQHLVGRKLINERIAAEHSAARKEVSAAQPGSREPEDLTWLWCRSPAGSRLGVGALVALQEDLRASGGTGGVFYAEEDAEVVTGGGAQVPVGEVTDDPLDLSPRRRTYRARDPG